MDRRDLVKELFCLVEKKTRKVEISGGQTTSFASDKHLKDLEKRVAEMTRWRDKEKRGSEARANYSRILNRIKRELATVRKIREKRLESDHQK